MQATYGANRVPGRFVEISAAALIALAIGATGGYIVKGLASVAPVTVSNPARVAATTQAVGRDAVDRAMARLRPLPALRDDSRLTINQVPALRDDSRLSISQDGTLSARRARQFGN